MHKPLKYNSPQIKWPWRHKGIVALSIAAVVIGVGWDFTAQDDHEAGKIEIVDYRDPGDHDSAELEYVFGPCLGNEDPRPKCTQYTGPADDTAWSMDWAGAK